MDLVEYADSQKHAKLNQAQVKLQLELDGNWNWKRPQISDFGSAVVDGEEVVKRIVLDEHLQGHLIDDDGEPFFRVDLFWTDGRYCAKGQGTEHYYREDPAEAVHCALNETLESNMVEVEQIGQAIRAVRKSSGMTQVELAEAAGCSENTVNAIENGRRSTDVATLWDIAEALGVRPSVLFYDAERQDVDTPWARMHWLRMCLFDERIDKTYLAVCFALGFFARDNGVVEDAADVVCRFGGMVPETAHNKINTLERMGVLERDKVEGTVQLSDPGD